MVIHEALHLEQSSSLAHSVEGERLAMQAGLRVYENLAKYNNPQFVLGSDYQNILAATTAADYADALRVSFPFYRFTMLLAYPLYPGWSAAPNLYPNCGRGGYCPPATGP